MKDNVGGVIVVGVVVEGGRSLLFVLLLLLLLFPLFFSAIIGSSTAFNKLATLGNRICFIRYGFSVDSSTSFSSSVDSWRGREIFVEVGNDLEDDPDDNISVDGWD